MRMAISKKDVRKLIASLPKIRPIGIPFESRAGCILVCDDVDAIRSAATLRDRFSAEPLYTAPELNEAPDGLSEELGITIIPFSSIQRRVHNELVVMASQTQRKASLRKTHAVQGLGRRSFYFSDSILTGGRVRAGAFEHNADIIVETVNKLGDEESRICYLSRLKALMLGDSGFIHLSEYKQYEHPVVRAEPGDRVCEGGAGGQANTTRMFSRGVGASGWVVAFEPVREQYESAVSRTTSAGNVTIENAGLWSEPGETQIRVAGPVSTMTGNPKHHDKPAQLCLLESIDHYFSEKSVGLPSLVKLDIEGAEREALRGGRSTIETARPKLQICLYHKLDHFLEIPLEYANMGYRVLIGHHTPFMNECVMYAIAR